jgi:rhomboid protease GluP
VISATNVLIAINVIVFVWEIATGGWGTDSLSLREGALYGPLVAQGQWWRIVTSAFLHGGLLHIAFNMFALFQVGRFLEMLIGSRRMLTIYAISMVGSGLAVYFFAYDQVTIGASGAIFGTFGALVAIGLRLGEHGRSLVMQTLPIIGINLFIGFTVPNISNAGHIGGLLSGFVAGFALVRIRRQPEAAVAVADEGDVVDEARDKGDVVDEARDEGAP